MTACTTVWVDSHPSLLSEGLKTLTLDRPRRQALACSRWQIAPPARSRAERSLMSCDGTPAKYDLRKRFKTVRPSPANEWLSGFSAIISSILLFVSFNVIAPHCRTMMLVKPAYRYVANDMPESVDVTFSGVERRHPARQRPAGKIRTPIMAS